MSSREPSQTQFEKDEEQVLNGIYDEKRLIRAPGDLVSKLNEAANRQGRSFYSYITEILEQAVRAYEMNRDLKEIINSYELLELHRQAGSLFTPRDILDHLISKVEAKDARILEQLWYQAGRWYGIYLREKFSDSVETFNRLLKDGRLDLNEISVKRNQETVELRCVSTLLSQERTVLLQKFIEGAMHSIGYRTVAQKCFRGIIRLKFSPQNIS